MGPSGNDTPGGHLTRTLPARLNGCNRVGQGWIGAGTAAGSRRLRAAHLLLALLSAAAASPGRASPPPAPGFALVLATVQGGETLFWQRLPEDPVPFDLARVRHEPDFLPRAALSPDGRWLAYTWLPEGSRDAGRAGRLGLLDLTSGAKAQLAANVDLRASPLWSSGSNAVLFRRTYWSEDAATRVELRALAIGEPGEGRLVVVEEAHTLVPLLWSPDGTLLYGRWGAGVDLRRIEPGAPAPLTVARLSDGPAHNLSLSPDEQTAAYTRPLGRGSPGQHGLFLVSLNTGAVRHVWSEASDHMNPVWRPDAQSVTIATRTPAGALASLRSDNDLLEAQPSTVDVWPQGRLEVPLRWSPDGRWLVIRSLQGADSLALTEEELVLIDAASGARQPIRGPGYTAFVGWRASAQ